MLYTAVQNAGPQTGFIVANIKIGNFFTQERDVCFSWKTGIIGHRESGGTPVVITDWNCIEAIQFNCHSTAPAQPHSHLPHPLC